MFRSVWDMKPSYKSFEELECWRAGREVRLFVFRQIRPILPFSERYRLADQLVRASRSITANIAEGYGRFHYLDNLRFCRIARGSCTEVLDHLITTNDESMVSAELLDEGRQRIGTSLRLLNGYMAYLQRAGRSDPNNQ